MKKYKKICNALLYLCDSLLNTHECQTIFLLNLDKDIIFGILYYFYKKKSFKYNSLYKNFIIENMVIKPLTFDYQWLITPLIVKFLHLSQGQYDNIMKSPYFIPFLLSKIVKITYSK